MNTSKSEQNTGKVEQGEKSPKTYTSQHLTGRQLLKAYLRLYQHNLMDEIVIKQDLDLQQKFFAWFGEDVWDELWAFDEAVADAHRSAGRTGRPPLARARLKHAADKLGLPSPAAMNQLYKGRAAKEVHKAFKAWLEKNKLPPMQKPKYRGPRRKQAEIAAEKAAKKLEAEKEARRLREIARIHKDLNYKRLQKTLTRLAGIFEELREITTMENVLLKDVRHVEELIDTPEEEWLCGWPMLPREAFEELRLLLDHEAIETFLTTGQRHKMKARKEPLPNKRTSKFTRLTPEQVAEITASDARTEFLADKYRVPVKKIVELRGTRQGHRKLTADQVRDILTYATVQDIQKKTRKRVQAVRYGVSHQAICKIHKGHTWPEIYAEVKAAQKDVESIGNEEVSNG